MITRKSTRIKSIRISCLILLVANIFANVLSTSAETYIVEKRPTLAPYCPFRVKYAYIFDALEEDMIMYVNGSVAYWTPTFGMDPFCGLTNYKNKKHPATLDGTKVMAFSKRHKAIKEALMGRRSSRFLEEETNIKNLYSAYCYDVLNRIYGIDYVIIVNRDKFLEEYYSIENHGGITPEKRAQRLNKEKEILDYFNKAGIKVDDITDSYIALHNCTTGWDPLKEDMIFGTEILQPALDGAPAYVYEAYDKWEKESRDLGFREEYLIKIESEWLNNPDRFRAAVELLQIQYLIDQAEKFRKEHGIKEEPQYMRDCKDFWESSKKKKKQKK